MSYESDLSIDENALEKEWLKQPSLYMHYAEKAALFDAKAKKAKESLETHKAELFLLYRKKYTERGEKYTEAIISAEVQTDDNYTLAYDEYIKAVENAAIMAGAVKAFDHKKAALENLVRLNLAGYYSEPREGETGIKDKAVTKQSVEAKQKYNEKRRKGSE